METAAKFWIVICATIGLLFVGCTIPEIHQTAYVTITGAVIYGNHVIISDNAENSDEIVDYHSPSKLVNAVSIDGFTITQSTDKNYSGFMLNRATTKDDPKYLAIHVDTSYDLGVERRNNTAFGDAGLTGHDTTTTYVWAKDQSATVSTPNCMFVVVAQVNAARWAELVTNPRLVDNVVLFDSVSSSWMNLTSGNSTIYYFPFTLVGNFENAPVYVSTSGADGTPGVFLENGQFSSTIQPYGSGVVYTPGLEIDLADCRL